MPRALYCIAVSLLESDVVYIMLTELRTVSAAAGTACILPVRCDTLHPS